MKDNAIVLEVNPSQRSQVLAAIGANSSIFNNLDLIRPTEGAIALVAKTGFKQAVYRQIRQDPVLRGLTVKRSCGDLAVTEFSGLLPGNHRRTA